MEEILNDDYCLNCVHAEHKNEDENGNSEYVECTLQRKNKAIDEWCESFA